MSADSPESPRDALEIRLTALLLGELSPEEEAALRAEIAQSADLTARHAELLRTIELVGQAAGSLQEESTAPVEGMKLSSARRERLLASFKAVRPPALASRRRFQWRELATLAAMLMLLLVLAGGIGLEFVLDPGRRVIKGLGDLSSDKPAAAAGGRWGEQGDKDAPAMADHGQVLGGLRAAAPAEPRGTTRGIGIPEEMDAKQRARGTESTPASSVTTESSLAQRGFGGGLAPGSLPELGRPENAARNSLEATPPPPAPPQGPATQGAPGPGFLAGEPADVYAWRFALGTARRAGGETPSTPTTAPATTPLDALALQENAPLSGMARQEVAPSNGLQPEGLAWKPSPNEAPIALGMEWFDSAGKKRTLTRANAATPALGKAAKSEVLRESLADLQPRPTVEAGLALEAKLSRGEDRIDASRAKVRQTKEDAKLGEMEQRPARSLAAAAPVPQPERNTAEDRFSTFSLNVTDVSFKLAAASLEKGQMPDPATLRSEEFINAFDYRDPEPAGGAPVAFAWERARSPFEQGRDVLRFSVKTAASGRQPGRPLNLVLLLDNSGSMERADRVQIRRECLRILAGQLQPQDHVSVVAFARTARLWVDHLPGTQASELPTRVGGLTPEGGTNLEEAMALAYQTARRHFLPEGVNRVVLLTDGAANLGDVQPESLKRQVESRRREGIALDCFGIGWEGFNDELMEALARNGDGRYGFVNTPEAAAAEFGAQLVGALKVAASDVKVQVEWNPRRVTAYRQVGYAKHQLTQAQFRDNSVDAAELGAAEAGNAIYTVQVNPAGEGPLGTVRVRFKVPGTADYREQEWPLAYDGGARSLEASSPALRLAVTASAFSEWLAGSPFAAEVTPDKLQGYLRGVPETWAADPRPKLLEWMIRQAGALNAK